MIVVDLENNTEPHGATFLQPCQNRERPHVNSRADSKHENGCYERVSKRDVFWARNPNPVPGDPEDQPF